MNKINVMQGRLSFPINEGKLQEFPKSRWGQEFDSSNLIGLNGIEWICDNDLSNPLLNLYTIERIKELQYKYSTNIDTFCMDFLEDIDNIFKGTSKNFLTSFIQAASMLTDVPKIIIPLFKKLTPEFVDKLENVTNRLMPIGTRYSRIFEIDDFDGYRKRFGGYRICYDIGNRQLPAPRICEELVEFHNNIYHIHIKEKDFNGTSVPLGQGVIGFEGWENIFDTLKKIKYKYDFTLQVARETRGNEVSTINKQFKYIKGLLNA